jgi:hypothetical protein
MGLPMLGVVLRLKDASHKLYFVAKPYCQGKFNWDNLEFEIEEVDQQGFTPV